MGYHIGQKVYKGHKNYLGDPILEEWTIIGVDDLYLSVFRETYENGKHKNQITFFAKSQVWISSDLARRNCVGQ